MRGPRSVGPAQITFQMEAWCSRELMLDVLRLIAKRGSLPDTPENLVPADCGATLKLTLERGQ